MACACVVGASSRQTQTQTEADGRWCSSIYTTEMGYQSPANCAEECKWGPAFKAQRRPCWQRRRPNAVTERASDLHRSGDMRRVALHQLRGLSTAAVGRVGVPSRPGSGPRHFALIANWRHWLLCRQPTRTRAAPLLPPSLPPDCRTCRRPRRSVLELPPRRALLYVPGDSESKIKKAAGLGVDVVCLDIEDAVAANRKHAARETVVQVCVQGGELQPHWHDTGCCMQGCRPPWPWLAGSSGGVAAPVPLRQTDTQPAALPTLYPQALSELIFGRSERAVRINGVSSDLCEDDLAAVLGGPQLPDALVVPKVPPTSARGCLLGAGMPLPLPPLQALPAPRQQCLVSFEAWRCMFPPHRWIPWSKCAGCLTARGACWDAGCRACRRRP